MYVKKGRTICASSERRRKYVFFSWQLSLVSVMLSRKYIPRIHICDWAAIGFVMATGTYMCMAYVEHQHIAQECDRKNNDPHENILLHRFFLLGNSCFYYCFSPVLLLEYRHL